jgi:mannose-6-phosphate isomerase
MPNANQPVQLVSCPYFTTNLLNINAPVVRDYYRLDSFAILIAVDGDCLISGEGFEPVSISKGETVLLPATLGEVRIDPIGGHVRLLEVYID